MRESLPDNAYRLMSLTIYIAEALNPTAARMARTFGIREGMTVVDYGCGPGRYTIAFARLVGERGRVIAVDLSKVAGVTIEKKARRYRLDNIRFRLARGYDSGVESRIADMVFALDMFFMVENPTAFLAELSRIAKDDGVLVIDDEHQSRQEAKRKLREAGSWVIIQEREDCLICKKS